MEHYYHAETCEDDMKMSDVPLDELPENLLWMRIKQSSRVQNVCDYALARLSTHSAVLWSALGAVTSKALLCVELMKKAHGGLHQVTVCCYHKVVEIWKPKNNAELDPIRVNKHIPALHVLLSSRPLMANSASYQAPNSSTTPFHSLRSSVPTKNTNGTSRSADISSSEVPQSHSHVQQTPDNAFKRRKKPRKKAAAKPTG